jgi:threonine aldolase
VAYHHSAVRFYGMVGSCFNFVRAAAWLCLYDVYIAVWRSPLNFASDNVYGVHPKIMEAMVAVNSGTDISYLHDDGAKEFERALSQVFEKDVKAFLVTNGTGANSLALSALVPSYGGIVCHSSSHINCDECNAPELFTGGAKLITLDGVGAKLTPSAISYKLKNHGHGEHGAKPLAISITQATELGTVYSVSEISAIGALAKSHKMKLHMDGARFANALVGLGCTAAEMTWKAGVDVLSFGGTKNGAMILEAVVFFDEELAEDFLYRRKRAGQLLSKGRYLSAQGNAYLKDGLWLESAKRANALATHLADGLRKSNVVRLSNPVQANEVFSIMPRKLFEKLTDAGAHFYEWHVDGLADDEVHTRCVLSWATPQDDVDQFLKLIQS